MIDYISAKIPTQDFVKVRYNNLLQWENTICETTGELTGTFCNYGNFKLKVNDKTPNAWIKLTGSIHKHAHKINNTDFGLSELKNELRKLCDEIGIHPNMVSIHNIEFGVNIETDVLPIMIFDKFIEYKRNEFVRMQRNRVGNPKAKGVICEHVQFLIKVYDKGTQTNLDTFMMRFEVKAKRMRYLERLGLPNRLYLSDLERPEIMELLGKILVSHYDGIVQTTDICTIKESALSGKDREFLRVANGRGYWLEKKKDVQNKKVTTKTYNRHLERFEQLKKQVSKDSDHDVIREKIVSKWQHLSSEVETEKGKNVQNSPLFQQYNYDNISGNENIENVQNSPLELGWNFGHLGTPEKSKNAPEKTRICEVCKTSIEHRKMTSKTCSKKCRNKLSNRIHDYTRKIPKSSSGLLFEVRQFVDMRVLELKQRARKER